MGFPYYLADGGWPGNVDIPELVKYAAERNVKIWLWEHSKDVRSPEIAEEKFKLWSSWGVVGVKIDFFESDRAERVKQYDYLARIAAKYRLMVNFHGAMKPAGEIRTWPHVLTREGVLGGEYLQNFSNILPMGPGRGAQLHPALYAQRHGPHGLHARLLPRLPDRHDRRAPDRADGDLHLLYSAHRRAGGDGARAPGAAVPVQGAHRLG